MQNFIVLGIIPGTNYQMTFNAWLCVAAGLLGLLALRAVWRQRDAIRVLAVAIRLVWFIDRYPLAA